MVNKDEYPGLGKPLVPQKWKQAKDTQNLLISQVQKGLASGHPLSTWQGHGEDMRPHVARWGEAISSPTALKSLAPFLQSSLSFPSHLSWIWNISFSIVLPFFSLFREIFPETRWSQPGRVLEARNGTWISKLLVLTKCLLNLLTSLLSPMTPSAQSRLLSLAQFLTPAICRVAWPKT